MSKPSAAHVFGWAEMHPGACCDCFKYKMSVQFERV